MASDTIRDFMVGLGFKVDTSSQAKFEAANAQAEKKVTAAAAAEADKRVAIEKKTTTARSQALRELTEIATTLEAIRHDQAVKLEEDRAEKAEKIKKEEVEKADKLDAEQIKKSIARRDAVLKSTRALVVGMTGLITGLAAGVTGAATGLLWATDRAAKHFEKLAYAGQASGSSAAGLSKFSYAASQLGTSVEDAQTSVAAFGENLKKLPAMEGMLKNMGIATRGANGEMREAGELAAEYVNHLKNLPQLQREAQAGAWGLSEATVRAAVRPEFARYGEEYDRIQGTVGANPNAAAQGAIGFEQAMRRGFEIVGAVKTRVETALFDLIRPRLDDVSKWVLDHGEAISRVVTEISKGLTDLATAFVQSEVVQDAIKGLGAGLERFAKYVASDDFKRDVHGFVEDVKALAGAIRWALEKIGILPSKAGDAVVPDPKGSFDDHEFSGAGASLRNRRSHGEKQITDNDHAARVRAQQNSFEAATPTGAHTPLKDLIASHETGGTGAAGYDTVYGHAEQPGSKMAAFAPPKPITQMTIGEILAYQRDMKARAHSDAFPVGRAQWVEHTLRGLTAGMDKNTVFTPEVQERLFDKSIAGRMEQGPNGFRSEWASLGGVNDATIGGAIEGHRKAMAAATPAADDKGQYPAWMDDRSRREMAAVNAPLARDLIAAAQATGIQFRVAQGLRTQEEANANAQSGRGVRNSQHLYGAAADIHLLDANGNVSYDRALYQRFADAYTAHSAKSGGRGRWLGNLGGRWGADIVHFDQGIGYGQTHERDPYGQGGPTKEDIAANNRAIYASPQNPFLHGPATSSAPVHVAITDGSAFKLGKAFVSSSPLLQVPHGASGNNPLADFRASYLRWADSHGKDLAHPGEKPAPHRAYKVQPAGMTPSMYSDYDYSRHKGDTHITHSPQFHIHGVDAKTGLDHARMAADRGPKDLVRNLKAVEQ